MDNRYLIIADDYTGANDTGVQLRRRGFPTEVLFSGKPVCQDKSVVIDTESRTVHPDHAYEIVSHALEQVDFSQFRHIIKKIDSTMRGNIAMEIRAVDEAFHPELIVFAPALPALGRTTVDGVQRLHGVEICKTELSRDPKNPVVEDNLVSLLGRIYEERIQLKRLPEIRSSSFSLTDSRIFVCDAETDEDLSRIVQATRRSQKTALYIGTAGIADSLMELEQPSLPSLGVAASISTVTNRQMHFCEQQGITLIKLPVDKILQGSDTAEHYVQKAVEARTAARTPSFSQTLPMIESFWSFPIRPVTPWVLPLWKLVIGFAQLSVTEPRKFSGRQRFPEFSLLAETPLSAC